MSTINKPHPIKKTVTESGISQKKISEKLGITPGHLNYMLNGLRPLSDDHKNAILNFINKIQ